MQAACWEGSQASTDTQSFCVAARLSANIFGKYCHSLREMLPYGTEDPSLSSRASFEAGSSRNASEEYSLIQEAYGPTALMMPGAANAAALS